MADVIPASFLAPDSQPWGRTIVDRLLAVERRTALNEQSVHNVIRQLTSSVEVLAAQVARLNTGSESKSHSQSYMPSDMTYNSQYVYADEGVATVSFVAPWWATGGNILAFSTFSASDSALSGFIAQVSTRIDSSQSGITNIQVPNQLEIRNGGYLTGDIAYDTSPAPTVTPHSYSFVATPGETYNVECVLTKDFSGGNSSFGASISATVFWTA